jgi:hypothetical protein
MCAGGPKVDVCIRDISSMGLMLQTNEPPPRGTYVEILGAGQTIIGRVIWAKGRRFGIRTNDPINVSSASLGTSPPPSDRTQARTARPRCPATTQTGGETQRSLAAAIQFTLISAFVTVLVVVLAGTAYETLRSPFGHIEKQLGHGR